MITGRKSVVKTDEAMRSSWVKLGAAMIENKNLSVRRHNRRGSSRSNP